jgi:hypothetical protein
MVVIVTIVMIVAVGAVVGGTVLAGCSEGAGVVSAAVGVSWGGNSGAAVGDSGAPVGTASGLGVLVGTASGLGVLVGCGAFQSPGEGAPGSHVALPSGMRAML